MEGVIGSYLIGTSFLASLIALIAYGFVTWQDGKSDPRSSGSAVHQGFSISERVANFSWALGALTMVAASAVLIYLLLTHQFQYFYVWNYSSLDLEMRYLFSAYYGGQEGSFMLWVLCGFLVGAALIRWTEKPYRAPVLFVMSLTQVFLISMVLGWDLFGLKIGADPFRTIAEEMPNAPFIQANPNFTPADGTGLNDLLKSPWMMIHPPVIFMGFAMMTVPFAFAIASLWTRTYHDWIRPALPWTLGANLSLLTAIFLGGYWAYETLSFGGYWAWDPVENASLVPWLVGTAGIHAMIIQRKSSRAHKASIFLSILAYTGIIYQTFLTRSGVLADQSVHSFVDLGLYGQLLIFILTVLVIGVGFYLYRYREIPSPQKQSKILSSEFMTFTGSMLLLILGLVIILGTSSPIIGRFFVENPTPPEISFYNQWSLPIAVVMAIFTVLGQHIFWKKYNWEELAGVMIVPLVLTSVATILSVIFGQVREISYMILIFAGWFAVFGNGQVMLDLLRRRASLIGGTLNHVGFGVLLLGIIASSVYTEPLLDQRTASYNARVAQGEVYDEEGFPVTQPIEMLELKRDQPTLVNNKWMVTYEGYELSNSPRLGMQTYRIRMEPLDGGKAIVMNPEVYPMLTTSSRTNIEWSVDPAVRTGWMKDIYLYVAGSQYVERENERVEALREQEEARMMPVSDSSSEGTTAVDQQSVEIPVGGRAEAGEYSFEFLEFRPAQENELPDQTQIGVRALVRVTHSGSGRMFDVEPLFAVYTENGQSYTYSPPLEIELFGMNVLFTSIFPENNAIELTVDGLSKPFEEDWVLIVAETKPFVSVVWLGTFLLMGGFSISIMRHWKRSKD